MRHIVLHSNDIPSGTMDLQLILMIFALIAMLNMAIIANVLLILPILFLLYDYYVLLNT